ncbi:signal peptidase II [Botrimarina hoheduenensis]|uniref:signal peptidase II n=1 Tax=Botrimarina hoheduenensis TaxID=2528000 RepID=UPI001E45F8F6|nr:signal peptidase II [Botrimarina hoheduenensis]
MSNAPHLANSPVAATSGGPPLSRYLAFGVLTVAGLAADLLTKAWLFSWPGGLGHIYWLIPDYVGLQTSLNEGALFGIGQGAVSLFAALSLAAALAIPVWLFAFRAANDWWLTITLGTVMGGVLGNLYDRLGLSGLRWGPADPRAGEPVYAVRDWILLQLGDAWRWPNFNIADSLLVVGAAALFLRAWLEPASPASPSRGSDALTEEPSPDLPN